MSSDLANDSASSLAIEAYRRAAEAQTLAVSICDGENVPLSEVQIAHMHQAFLHAFDGTQAVFADLLSIDASIRTGRLSWLLGTDL